MRPSSQRGFALLITVTLLALLVLVLVSLSTLTRVETSVASNFQTHDQARQNALLALNLALGELQKNAGPDQRITAVAILGEADQEGGTDHRTGINGLVQPLLGARYWTGVWGNPDAPDAIYSKTPAPVLLSWLVSGNEGAPVVTAASDGRITAPATANPVSFRPGTSLPDLSDDTTALSDLGNWSLLVGPASVGRLSGGGLGPSGYVAAPLRPLAATGVPGFEATQSVPVGRYAWWVGDEGVKARYNLRDDHAATIGLTLPDAALVEGRYRLALAQRNGIERIAELGDYPVNAPALDRVFSSAQVAFAHSGIGNATLGRRFHDLTWFSRGVLASSQRGGLREDLTWFLARGGKTGNILPADDTLFPEASLLQGPRWETLKAFHDDTVAASGSGTLAISSGDASTPPVAPVIVQVRYRTRLRIATDGQCFMRIAPLVVLGNPYDVALSGRVDIRFLANGDVAGITATSSYNEYRVEFATDIPDRSAEEATWAVSTEDNVLPTTGTLRSTSRFFRPHDISGARGLFTSLVLRTPEFTISPGGLMMFSLPASLAQPSILPAANANLVIQELAADAPLPDVFLDIPVGTAVVPPSSLSQSGDPPRLWALRVRGSMARFNPALFSYQESPPLDPQEIEPLRTVQQVGIIRNEPSYKEKWVFDAPESLPYETDLVLDRHTLQLPATQSRRIFADYNLRARHLRRPLVHHGSGTAWRNPLFATATFRHNQNHDANFLADLLEPKWGRSLTIADGHDRLVLFDLRHAANGITPTTDDGAVPLLSLGALQHADLTADAVAVSVGHQPGYALGNSLATPYVPRSRPAALLNNPAGTPESYYDISYLLNAALWDEYFFSTVPQSSTASLPDRLPNARMRPLTTRLDALQDGQTAAAHLLVDGAFNVNSTSVEAWKAVLSGSRFAVADTRHSRSLHQPGGRLGADDTAPEAYDGYRSLTDAEVDRFAIELVDQVRRRGPFISLAHFVNRALVPGPATVTASETAQTRPGLKGALQTAIDDAGLNEAYSSDINTTSSATDRISYKDGDVQATLGPTAMAAPGWLTQADLLQTLGPALAARSDTFLIRAYGDVLDPLASTPENPAVQSRAWCEAVVQRLPDPVLRRSGDTTSPDYHEPVAATPSQPDFGRSFRIVSFRWLGPNDI